MEIAAKVAHGPMFWDLPEENQAAVELARELGFNPVRRLKRMARGEAPTESLGLVYALSGFETG